MTFSDATRPDSIGELTLTSAPGAYAVKLPIFEGPLDLLLHLIRQDEVEITDIPVARIAEQYLDYLELMHDLDLDVAGDYLVMAATLALIKSRMLLPPEPGEEGQEPPDPRTELIARLLEYQRFKEVAEALALKRRLGRDVFDAQGALPLPVPESERDLEVGLFELLEAFRRVLSKADASEPVHAVELEVEKFTVRDRMLSVMERLASAESIEFAQIFDTPIAAAVSRPLVIATFLAILELARLSALRIYQGLADDGSPSGPIRLRRSPEGAEVDWRARISELM
jgi:segregation and condensation protein A